MGNRESGINPSLSLTPGFNRGMFFRHVSRQPLCDRGFLTPDEVFLAKTVDMPDTDSA